MIETLDTSLRLVAVGASLLLLVLLVLGEVRRDLKLTLLGLLLGAVAYLFNSSSVFRTWIPYLQFVDLASLFTPFWLWLFARSLFERTPPGVLVWSTGAIMLLSWFAGTFLPWSRPVGFYVIHAVALALIADLVRVALSGRNDDLIEKRRLIRLWFPILVAAQSGGILLYEVIAGAAIAYPPLQLLNAVLILALTLFSGIALLRTDPELLVETENNHTHIADRSTLSASEKVLHDNLREAMAAGYYRTPGMTIASLADHLGVPEHRLRALINRRLGHRNFSAYLNRHRIAEACAILADRDRVDLPVLTIAMDLGYNSLATFNRAFRAETGTTPTDYRHERLGPLADQN